MIVDTSALAAILFSEPERAAFIERIDRDPAPKLSVVSLVEATLVVEGRLGRAGGAGLDALLRDGAIAAVAVDRDQAELAREAFRRFGKGRHPAGLNFGDCFSYALAKATGEKLLFKGDDFARTDIATAA
jgi:ribonuclease VapC